MDTTQFSWSTKIFILGGFASLLLRGNDPFLIESLLVIKCGSCTITGSILVNTWTRLGSPPPPLGGWPKPIKKRSWLPWWSAAGIVHNFSKTDLTAEIHCQMPKLGQQHSSLVNKRGSILDMTTPDPTFHRLPFKSLKFSRPRIIAFSRAR